MSLNKPEDIDAAIVEIKEILEQATTEEERSDAQKMLDHFINIKSGKRIIEPLWSS